MTVSFDDFMKIDIRAGTITEVQDFPEARRPAYKLWIDFGAELGTRKTSAQITENYSPNDLIGKKVAAVVNFSPKQVGKFMSEVLTLGFKDENGYVSLVKIDESVPDGNRLH